MAVLEVGYASDGTAKTYTTVSAAHTAASDGDEIEVFYGNVSQSLKFNESITISKRVTIYGNSALPFPPVFRNISFTFQCAGTITISNIGMSRPSSTAWSISLAAGSSGELIMDSLYARGGKFVVSAVNGAVVRFRNCLTEDSDFSAFEASGSVVGSVYAQNCTAANPFAFGFKNMECTNCLTFGSAGAAFQGCTGDYNSSNDATAPGANSIQNNKITDIGLLSYADGGRGYRLGYQSNLIGAGDATNQPANDFYGVAYTSGTIGCQAGIFVERDRANVLVEAGGTFDESARNTDPGIANVKLSTAYKIRNVDYTGTYDPTGSPPNDPVISITDNGDGTGFTVNVTVEDQTFDVSLWYKSAEGTSWTLVVADHVGNIVNQSIMASPGRYFFKASSENAAGISCSIETAVATTEGSAATDNISVAVKAMKQKAVYWGLSTLDAFGKPMYEDPVEIDCRWEKVQEEFVDANGDRVISKAKLIVDRDLELKGVLWLGELEDLIETDDPKENDDAWEIRLFKKTPDFKGTKFIREVYL